MQSARKSTRDMAPPAGSPAGLAEHTVGAGGTDAQTEAALVRSAVRGDTLSFRALYERCSGPAFRLALGIIRRPDGAEEVVQEAFCQAWAGLRGFQGQARFRTWLLSIVRNAALDMLRREKTRREADRDRMAERLGGVVAPDVPARTKELRRALAQALAELPEETSTAFVLAVLEGLRYAEVSDVMKTSVDGVKCRVYRAREHLRRRLGAFRTDLA
jgi:RNA polymerase sigma-70 factor (ECF subfamily)